MSDDEFDGLARITGDTLAEMELYDDDNADQLRMRVLKVRDDIAVHNIEVGRMLRHIQKTGMFTRWQSPEGKPYKTFKEYVETEVDFKLRKVNYLMSVAWWFTDKHRDPKMLEAVKDIGWTKMAALVGVATPSNVEEWAEIAKSMSADLLKSEVKAALDKSGKKRESMERADANPKSSVTEDVSDNVSSDISESITEDVKTDILGDEKGEVADRPASRPDDVVDEDQASEPEPEERSIDPVPDDEEKERRTRMGFTFSKDQRENVEDAIARAAEIAEVAGDANGYLLDFICTSFLALYSGSGSSTRERQVNMRNDILLAVQRTLGVDIIAFKKGTPDPIFGENTIDRLMEMTDESES